MAIAELGGPTTQAGISYQNAIAALYLGQMLDPRLDATSRKIVEVRVEAPEDVDDIVVTLASGTKWYIQAKESVSKANDLQSTWGKVWKDFEVQFNRVTFKKGQDRLKLCSGLHKEEIVKAKDLVERASTSKSFEEWQERIKESKILISFFKHLTTFLSPELNNNKDDLLLFFASIDVEIAPRQFVEKEKILYLMPESNQPPSALFSLLRDRVGGVARLRGSHTVKNLQEWLQENHIVISEAVSLEELRSAIYSCSSILRHQKNTMGKTGLRLSRDLYKNISKWLLETTDKESIGVLLDQAGTGKTVLFQEVLMELERQEIDVLAIKADQQLSGVQSLEDIQSKLDLPVRMERLAGMLAIRKHFIVLIDQIDALSLSMAHDQRALSLTLDMIARLRFIPGVRILISCRKFDFDSDPRIKNFEDCKTFSLGEFSEEEITTFLNKMGLDYTLMLPSTQKLLRIPLHLNLFLMAYESEESKKALQDRGFSSLQELYQLVWDRIIMKQQADAPPAWEREQVLILMAKYMDKKQRVTVPKSLFTQRETSGLERAVSWLSSEGIVLADGKELGFFHQTFFDYCYARDFVQQGRSLVNTLLTSPQGLFQRPQLVQVLSYLRGQNDKRSYFKQLNALLAAGNLRYHLKNHLYRWFATIPTPVEQEWRLVKRLSVDLNIRSQLLQFSYGNPEWFEYWRNRVLPEMLSVNKEEVYEEVFGYLLSMMESRQKDVIEFLLPYYTRSSRLEQFVQNFILHIRVWKCQEAVQLLEVVMDKIELDHKFAYNGWKELARQYPEALCRILRNFMNRALKNYKRKKHERGEVQTESYQFCFTSLKQEINKLDSTQLEPALQVVVDKSALYFLDSFIPWLIEAVKVESYESIDSKDRFIPDSLFRGWYSNFLVEMDCVMNETLVKAFVKLAEEQPQTFIEKIEHLSSIPYSSTQFLVAHVLRQVPNQYANISLRFLLDDPRRLNIGDYDDFESRQLIKSIIPYLGEAECRGLEDFVLTRFPLNKKLKLDGYRFHDLSQLGLLRSISWENLSLVGKKRLLELERKFPGYREKDTPHRPELKTVSSPISIEAASKMTNRQWLRAITKYQRGIRHPDWSKGGAESLAPLLQELVKKDPQRFFNLFNIIEDRIDINYVCALLNGLAESDASGSLLFAAIDHFKNHEDRDIQKTISWAVEKRANEDVPGQIIQLLNTYLQDASLTEPYYAKEPSDGYLNSVRGAAMYALMRVFSEKEDEKWHILSYAVKSDDVSLRAGAIQELVYMIHLDRDRSLDLFEQAVNGYPQLYRIPFTDDFCYWAMGKPFERLIPHLDAFINDEKEEIQQRGAELVAVSLISKGLFESEHVQKRMEALLAKVLTGPSSHRRGVAKIFSNNLLSNPCQILINGIYHLMNDEDEEVQRRVSFFLYNNEKIRQNFSEEIRTFISDFAESRSVIHSGYSLGTILWEQALDYPEWTLSVIRRLLVNKYLHNTEGWKRIDSKSLIHAVMNIYTDPLSDDGLQSQAMDTFDSLMELYSIQAQVVLAEWDRR